MRAYFHSVIPEYALGQSVSTYFKNQGGLTLAIARCNYLANRRLPNRGPVNNPERNAV
jgi:hypothetical protein